MMAAIDKIYANKEQHDRFKSWCEKELPEAVKYFHWDDRWEQQAIALFPEEIDFQLIIDCPILFVRDQLASQYSLDYIPDNAFYEQVKFDAFKTFMHGFMWGILFMSVWLMVKYAEAWINNP
jgi:hypothetical protein